MGVGITAAMINAAAGALIPTGTRPVGQVARDVLEAALAVAPVGDTEPVAFILWSPAGHVVRVYRPTDPGGVHGDAEAVYRHPSPVSLSVDAVLPAGGDERDALVEVMGQAIGDAADIDSGPQSEAAAAYDALRAAAGSPAGPAGWPKVEDVAATILGEPPNKRRIAEAVHALYEPFRPAVSPVERTGDGEPVAWREVYPGGGVILHEEKPPPSDALVEPLYRVERTEGGETAKVTPAEQTMMALLGAAEEEIERTRSRYTGVKRALEGRQRVIDEAHSALRSAAYATDEFQATTAREVAELLAPFRSDDDEDAPVGGSSESEGTTDA